MKEADCARSPISSAVRAKLVIRNTEFTACVEMGRKGGQQARHEHDEGDDGHVGRIYVQRLLKAVGDVGLRYVDEHSGGDVHSSNQIEMPGLEPVEEVEEPVAAMRRYLVRIGGGGESLLTGWLLPHCEVKDGGSHHPHHHAHQHDVPGRHIHVYVAKDDLSYNLSPAL
jgi:hypothetical protein